MNASSSSTALILGASRGIGYELAVQLREKGWKVTGTTRKPLEISGVDVVQLDITDDKSVEEAALKVGPIDLLVVNAGMAEAETLLSSDADRLRTYLETNLIGPHRAVKAFLPSLRRGSKKQIIFMSSVAGSLSMMKDYDELPIRGPYPITKAALNMLAVQYHNELSKSEGFTVIPLHPGWVATDMGNQLGEGATPVCKSVSDIVGIIEGLTLEKSAHFLDYKGDILPW
ncbi:hypothetical protein ACQY0O_006375 [Thecaphora frezii]